MLTLIESSVGITDTYCDPSAKLFGMSCRPDSSESLDYGAFSIVHVSQGADVNLRLDLLTLPTGRLGLGLSGKV